MGDNWKHCHSMAAVDSVKQFPENPPDLGRKPTGISPSRGGGGLLLGNQLLHELSDLPAAVQLFLDFFGGIFLIFDVEPAELANLR